MSVSYEELYHFGGVDGPKKGHLNVMQSARYHIGSFDQIDGPSAFVSGNLKSPPASDVLFAAITNFVVGD